MSKPVTAYSFSYKNKQKYIHFLNGETIQYCNLGD